MFDVWSAVQWWEEWQLRILVLASLAIQWFLLLAAPMRKYSIRRWFRTCIWLAYISSDALAIYALATLFNRHAKAGTSGSCGGIASKASILEVLWAPILLIHLGGQEELTAYTIEDNELWIRHTVTLVSQVAVAMYAFYKTWPSSGDRRLLASAIMLFVIGVISFAEKPWALKRARIHRLAEVSAVIQGTKKRTRWGAYLDEFFFFDSLNCFTMLCGDKQPPSDNGEKEEEKENKQEEEGRKAPILTDGDKVYMVLSDLSLAAAATDLKQRNKADNVEDVLQPLSPKAEKGLKRWLRGAFGLIYTRVNVAFTRKYLAYHLVLAPALHIAALTLFAKSDKHAYNRTDVKITYIILCLTAALDVLAVFIRQLLYLLLSTLNYPALCEMVPGHNIMNKVLRRRHKDIGWAVKLATRLGCKEEDFDCCEYRRDDNYRLYEKVSGMVLMDLVGAQGRDLAGYRVFTVQPRPRGLAELPEKQGEEEEELGNDGIVVRRSSSTLVPRPPSAEQGEVAALPVEVEHTDEPLLGGDEITSITTQSSGSNQPPRDKQRKVGRVPLPAEKKSAGVNWVLDEKLQRECSTVIRKTLTEFSFDKSVLVWHIATDLCYRMQPERLQTPPPAAGGGGRSCCWMGWIPSCSKDRDDQKRAHHDHGRKDPLYLLRVECAEAISDYMAHLLSTNPDMLLTGSRRHLVAEAVRELESILDEKGVDRSGKPPSQEQLEKIIEVRQPKTSKTKEEAGRCAALCTAATVLLKHKPAAAAAEDDGAVPLFHIPEACRLADELLGLQDEVRWKVIYQVWLGMLCYSASMCRGYLHAKSLGEGGEFLSFVWLVLSLKGAKTLADKLQMP